MQQTPFHNFTFISFPLYQARHLRRAHPLYPTTVVSHALGRIRSLRKTGQKGKKRRRLTDEQPIRGQGIERGHCSSGCIGRTNDRDDRERAAKEYGGFGHDQVGLERLPAKRRGIEVGKRQPIGGVGERRRIAGFVVPRLKVHCFGGAETEQDSQHFRVGDPLSQRWVQAGAALFDKSEVEAGRVGDRL